MLPVIIAGIVIVAPVTGLVLVAGVRRGFPERWLDSHRPRVPHLQGAPGYELSGYDNILRAWRAEHRPTFPMAEQVPVND